MLPPCASFIIDLSFTTLLQLTCQENMFLFVFILFCHDDDDDDNDDDLHSDSDSEIYLFDHIITNILYNYQFYSEYKRVIGQGDLH